MAANYLPAPTIGCDQQSHLIRHATNRPMCPHRMCAVVSHWSHTFSLCSLIDRVAARILWSISHWWRPHRHLWARWVSFGCHWIYMPNGPAYSCHMFCVILCNRWTVCIRRDTNPMDGGWAQPMEIGRKENNKTFFYHYLIVCGANGETNIERRGLNQLSIQIKNFEQIVRCVSCETTVNNNSTDGNSDSTFILRIDRWMGFQAANCIRLHMRERIAPASRSRM